MKVTICLLSALVCVSASRERVLQVKGDPRLARDHGARLGGIAHRSFKEGGAFRALPAQLVAVDPPTFDAVACQKAFTDNPCSECAKPGKCYPSVPPTAPDQTSCKGCLDEFCPTKTEAILKACFPASVPNPPI